MKKTVVFLVVALFSVILLASCGHIVQSPAAGGIFTEVKAPLVTGPTTARATKVGTAMAKTVLGLVATGDASIETAMRNGGITRIHHVDYEAKSILFFYGEFTTIVYGD
jgi:hypothetical protein